MAAWESDYRTFKKAIAFSLMAHTALFILILISPYLPKTSRKGMIHYVNVITLPGGGSGGGSSGGGKAPSEKILETDVPQRESLRDLTTPQKLQEQKPPVLTHPQEKPQKDKKPPETKKAIIQKQTPQSSKSQKASGESAEAGEGPGVRIGIGGGPGSGIGGSSFSPQIGLSSFPFTYYLQIIVDRISSNWYTSQVSPGLTGSFHTTVFFKIFKDGRISDIKIEESSGIKSLDLSALRAIQSSAPFPSLPREYEDEYLGIHLIFEHNK